MLATILQNKVNFISLPKINIHSKRSLKDKIKDELKYAKSYSSTKEIWDDVDNW